jgi:broad specificity phosphatase PhoE
MVPGGFKRFPDGEKAERVQDRHMAAIARWRYEPNGARKLLVLHRIF